MTLLEIDGLTIEYQTEDGPLRAIDNVDIRLEEGETLGIVGESGCGKTTIAKSIPRLLPDNGRVTDGKMLFGKQDLAELTKKELRQIRWVDISYIVQNAMAALDPVYRIESQFVEVIRAHSDQSKKDARQRTQELLTEVGLDENVLSSYPHELSGGQRQRAVIALSLALNPSIIIADEPTTGLDVIIQDEILELLGEIQSEMGVSLIFISHDISAVVEVADRIAVMYGGRIAEIGTTREVLRESAHPYTMGLRNAFPSLSEEKEELVTIPGSPPDLINPPEGCRFIQRCPFSTEHCNNEPPLTPVDENSHSDKNQMHRAKCHYTDQAEEFREQSKKPNTWEQ